MNPIDADTRPAVSSPADLTAAQLSEAFRSRRLSPVEVVAAVLERIEAEQVRLNAFAAVLGDRALTDARESERRWLAGRPRGPLDGVPFTIKDVFDLDGTPTRRGSRTTSGQPVVGDAPAVRAMLAAGCVPVGKTTTAEFGWTATTDTPLQGVTRNPVDVSRTSGGSSGGSAAAVAARLGAISLGTDAGGSVRIPAAFCGVVGFKPTVDRIPVWPPTPYGALAHAGTFTRDVPDAVLTWQALTGTGHQPHSSTRPFPDRIGSALRDLRVGVVDGPLSSGPAGGEVSQLVASATDRLRARGAQVTALELPWDPTEVRAAFRVMWCSGLANLYASMPRDSAELLNAGLVRTAEEGQRLTGAQFAAALAVCARLRERMHRLHQRYDVLVSATTPCPAPPIMAQDDPEGPALTWPEWSPMTYPFNLTGQPAISVPTGTTREGLPIGLQIVGDRDQDTLVLAVAGEFEQAQEETR